MPKRIFSISFLLLTTFTIIYFYQKPSLGIYKKNAQMLQDYLNPNKFRSFKSDTLIRLTVKANQQDSLYKKLYDAEIINENSYIQYNPPNCISLVTRKKNSFFSFKDYVIFFNLNIGEFICNINSIYSLNSDENVNRLSLKVYQLDEFMNLAVVEN
ncbi:MAG: hypothetical protein WCH59_04315 [Chitinophagia bacterium]|jgi:hypothetical protein